MRIRQLFFALLMLATPMVSFALDNDDEVPLPEPATLALLGAGVVAVIVTRAKKRK